MPEKRRFVCGDGRGVPDDRVSEHQRAVRHPRLRGVRPADRGGDGEEEQAMIYLELFWTFLKNRRLYLRRRLRDAAADSSGGSLARLDGRVGAGRFHCGQRKHAGAVCNQHRHLCRHRNGRNRRRALRHAGRGAAVLRLHSDRCEVLRGVPKQLCRPRLYDRPEAGGRRTHRRIRAGGGRHGFRPVRNFRRRLDRPSFLRFAGHIARCWPSKRRIPSSSSALRPRSASSRDMCFERPAGSFSEKHKNAALPFFRWRTSCRQTYSYRAPLSAVWPDAPLAVPPCRGKQNTGDRLPDGLRFFIASPAIYRR